MTQAEQRICRYSDQRKELDIGHRELDAENWEALAIDDADIKALEIAAGFLILSHHPKRWLDASERRGPLNRVAR